MSEKREKIIKIRVSPEEHELLKHLSTKAQLAEWMRESCLNYGQGDLVVQAKGPDPVDPQLLRQLAAIGNNLNQIGRRVNSGEWGPSDRLEILSGLRGIEQQMDQLRDLFR